MRKLMHLSCVLLGVAAVGAGCQSSHVAVEARSASIGTYEASLGHLNTPAFALGDLVAMDPQSHKAWKVASLQVDPVDVAFSQQAAKDDESFAAPLDLSYSKKITPGMKEDVDQGVQSQTLLHVENYWTRKLKAPAAFAAGSEQLAKALNKQHAQEPDTKFFLVSAVTQAENVYLAYAGGKADTATSGKYQFHINYQQNSELSKLAKENPAFFKLTPLKLDETGGQSTVAVDKDFGEQLPDYQFKQSIASTW